MKPERATPRGHQFVARYIGGSKRVKVRHQIIVATSAPQALEIARKATPKGFRLVELHFVSRSIRQAMMLWEINTKWQSSVKDWLHDMNALEQYLGSDTN